MVESHQQKYVGTNLFSTHDIIHRDAVIRKERLPALDSHANFDRIYKVLLIGVNIHRKTEQNGVVFARHLHNRKKIEFYCRIIINMFIETSRVSRKNLIPLHNGSADMLATGVSINVNWFYKVGECEQDHLHNAL